MYTEALYPGLFAPVFVAYSNNVGKGLVKQAVCRDVPERWADVWSSGAFLLYSHQASFESKKHHQDCLMSTA